MIWLIVGVGIVLNWIVLGLASDKEPEGAMGMAFAIPFTLIPFLFVGLYLYDRWFK